MDKQHLFSTAAIILIVLLLLVYQYPRNVKIRQDDTLVYGEKTLEKRTKVLKNVCANANDNNCYHGKNWDELFLQGVDERPRFFFSDRYKFLVCATPKCGTTEWRKFVLLADKVIDAYSTEDCKGGDIMLLAMKKKMLWNVFDGGTSRGKRQLRLRLNKYYKLMTVREPLGRLVSAYRNKLEQYNQPEFVALSKAIHKKYGNGSDGLATFSEFVDSILDTNDSRILNRHWRPYTDLCNPCEVEYDYILKLETIYDDISYIGQKLGIERNRFFSDSKEAPLEFKWNSKYPTYFAQLTPAKRQAIFEYYRTQYDAFGYTYPDFIK